MSNKSHGYNVKETTTMTARFNDQEQRKNNAEKDTDDHETEKRSQDLFNETQNLKKLRLMDLEIMEQYQRQSW